MIPERFTGGWARRSIQLGDGAPHEASTVVWLQAGLHFADLRVPRDEPPPAGGDAVHHPVMSFAGTTTWMKPASGDSDGRLVWHHVLDLDAWTADDGGDVRFDGDDLVEEGTFGIDGTDVAYTEVWVRLPGSTGEWLVLETPDHDGCLVQVGNQSLTIVDDREGGGAYKAIHRVLVDGVWTPSHGYGSGADALPAPPTPQPTGSTLTMQGRTWVVVEQRPAPPSA